MTPNQYWQGEIQQNGNNQKTNLGRQNILWKLEATNKWQLTWENMDITQKGNLKRETKSLQIAAQNNTIRVNYIKARIDKTQQYRRWRLCGDREEIILYILSKCSKLAQKEYKSRHARMVKVIHEQWCKKFQLWPYIQMVYCITQHPSWGMRHTNYSGILTFKYLTWSQLHRQNNQQRKGTCRMEDFAALADHWEKL